METAQFVLEHQEGTLRYHEVGYFNWQSPDELQALYQELGMRWLVGWPIDRYAWLAGVDPSRLSADGRNRLLALERSTPGGSDPCARYVCVMAQRPERGSPA